MSASEIQTVIENLHQKYQGLADGSVATYIPELAKANPEHFGICIVTADGRVFETGDCDHHFTIQSISKPFTFGMALEEFGRQEVARRVGVEPSGDAFNSIELQGTVNRPHNPMVNSGAITVTALLHSRWGDQTFDHLLDGGSNWTKGCMSRNAGLGTATGLSPISCLTLALYTMRPSRPSTSISGSVPSA